jgi:hypothetical protein
MRTHALVGPLGGVSVVLADRITYWFLPAALIIIAVISISPYRARAAHTQNFSIRVSLVSYWHSALGLSPHQENLYLLQCLPSSQR